ncbi:MAG: hypothetical protein ACJ752_05130 [Gaiellaceae bacterium]
MGKWALADGEAAWIDDYTCSNSECDWNIVAVHAGARRPRKIDFVAAQCDYVCGLHRPHPTIAAAGNVLVYSATDHPGDVFPSQWVNRVVGGKFARWFDVGGQIERLAAAGGVVEAVARVLSGDGCGCLRSPAWSVDGSTIAYLHGQFYRPAWEPGPSVAPLALMNADGSGRHDLTKAGSAQADSLTWSPDSQQIAYRTASGNLAVVSADGSASRQLGPGSDPAWSPDGSKIAFAASDVRNNPALFRMNPDGTGVQELASFAGHNLAGTGIAWSPDGSRISFSVDGLLEVMDADGSNAHSLGANAIGDEPAWSPDSSQIVFHTSVGLSLVGADGSGLHQLTTGPDEHPSWSPDGQTIVFASGRDDAYANRGENYYRAFLELYLVDADGGNLRPLSFTQPSALRDQATLRTTSGKHLPSLPGLPALAGNIAAIRNVIEGVAQIALYDATTGEQLAQVAVGSARDAFSVAGADRQWVVFHRGRTISALNVGTHRVVHLATAAAGPLDLSVSGRRVAWAENLRGGGRIRAVELPS